MKTQTRLLILGLLITLLLVPFSAQAADLNDDKVIFGGNFTLPSGETLNGDIVIFGGNATIEEDATVNGDVAVFGGRMRTDGVVNGDVVVLGGFAQIGDQAVIQGSLTALGSNVDRADGATVQGSVVTQTEFPMTFSIPDLTDISTIPFPRMGFWATPFVSFSLFFLRIIVWAGLAVLVTLFFREQTDRVNAAAFTEPVMSTVVGILAAILLPVLVIALLITILLSPLSFVAVLIATTAWVLGLISLGYEVGQRLTKNMESKIDPALTAGLGAFLVMLILNGFSKLIPCLGFFPKLFVGLWMFGAVLLTRFGSRVYSRQAAPPAAPSRDAAGEEGTDKEKSDS